MNSDRLRENLEKARQKAAVWQARAKDFERRVTEQENLEIIRAVREISATPEELKTLLGQIKAMKEPPLGEAENKEETESHEEEN